MPKAAFHNLGCKVNAYETEAMEQQLKGRGYEIVPFDEDADVYIVNTCSVTNIADRKSRQMLHRAKKKNPSALVVAVGCYAQVAADELEKDPSVDIIIGNNQKSRLWEILEDQKTAGGSGTYLEDIAAEKSCEPLRLESRGEHTRAFIKVQDGCNQFCSYCIIPYARGRVRSRSPQDVEDEIRSLAEKGYKEAVLTGIHLSSYGTERMEGGPIRGGDWDCRELISLIERVHEIPGLERIRLGSLEPRIITREFAGALQGLPKFCPHFHLSLQSGCDSVLKRMNRHYTTEDYARRCGIIREYFPNAAITTDVIVGFPGETEEEFRATEKFVEDVHFYEMHIFKYSRRAGTRAAAMPGQVPEPVKAERSAALLKLGDDMSREFRKRFLGRRLKVLFEETEEADGRLCMVGYTPEYVKAALDLEAEGLSEAEARARFGGKIVPVRALALGAGGDAIFCGSGLEVCV